MVNMTATDIHEDVWW